MAETIVITGLAGALLVSHDGGRSFELHAQGDRSGSPAAALAADGSLVTVGEAGIKSIAMPGASP